MQDVLVTQTLPVPSPSGISTPKTFESLELIRVALNLLLIFLDGLERAKDVRLDLELVELAWGKRTLMEDRGEATRTPSETCHAYPLARTH